MNSRNTFKKTERLKSQKKIDELFISGSSFLLYPFKVVFVLPDENVPEESLKEKSSSVQVLFSVPKKRIKLAADRNKIRRKVLEAYRLRKHALVNFCSEKKISLTIGFIFSGEKGFTFLIAKEKM
ncbi:MAG: ribonuclease P protein component, partial [Sphingobacteriales bacterium]